jgi:hypothetical protein
MRHDSKALEAARESLARLVVSDDGHKRRPGAEAGEVLRHVPRDPAERNRRWSDRVGGAGNQGRRCPVQPIDGGAADADEGGRRRAHGAISAQILAGAPLEVVEEKLA